MGYHYSQIAAAYEISASSWLQLSMIFNRVYSFLYLFRPQWLYLQNFSFDIITNQIQKDYES
ncbi:unnamed protein product [Rhodiola kirilowii]